MIPDDELKHLLSRLIDRIEQEDSDLRAMVGVDRALVEDQVNRLFRKFHIPDKRGPLFGLTLGVKDIINVDGMETGCGTALPAHLFRGAEAGCVDRLRRAGMVVLGKTQTTEFACIDPGPTRNPLNPEHTPGGSSSGSAAAVRAGFCDFALGTQTIGSVIRPAAYCGIAGFKPSYDRLPCDGVFPFSVTVDTVGVFCQGAETLLDICPALLDCWGLPARPFDIDNITLGIPDDAYLDQADDEVRAAFHASLEQLTDAGYHVKQTEIFTDIGELNRIHQQLIAGEMYRVHRGFLDEYRELYRPLTLATIDRGADVDDQTLETLIETRQNNLVSHTRAMADAGVDFWLAPPTATLAPAGLESTGNPIMNLPFTHLGLPTICLPAHRAGNNLRHALQVAAPYFHDEELVELALEIETILTGD